MSGRVLNAHVVGRGVVAGRVYVGRPSKWGNPFEIGYDGTRDEVIAKYREWLFQQSDLLAALPELFDADLVCWCAPEACHADVLAEIVLHLSTSGYHVEVGRASEEDQRLRRSPPISCLWMRRRLVELKVG